MTTDLPEFPPLDKSHAKANSPAEIVLASFGSRLLALAIDLSIIAIIIYITMVAAAASYRITYNGDLWGNISFYIASYLFSNLFLIVYLTYFIADTGQTPGKAAAGIKVVNLFGKEAGFARALFRAFGYYLSSLFFMAGFLWSLLDRRRQTWHDKLAGTIVVEI